MKTIKRKTMLYKTDVEYGDFTMNHIQGCSHGCNFPCYAFLMAKRFGRVSTYEEWLEPYLVENTLELLRKEIPKLKHKIQSVQLCFMSDPFMVGYAEVEKMSMDSIRLLNSQGIKCSVLTKGILPRELQDCSEDNEYGITLVSLNEEFRQEKEPFTSTYEDRIAALQYLHEQGCKTWISMEPYPTPNQVEQELAEILDAVSFVDKIIFGRTNYCKEVSTFKNNKFFYNQQVQIFLDFCREKEIDYHIKKGTVTENF